MQLWLKVVTALAAKLELADDFKFETRLEQFGNNWVVRFSGDPTLQTDDLKALFTTAHSKGLKRIKGDIWLDNSAFTGYDRAVGWPWDILGVCYKPSCYRAENAMKVGRKRHLYCRHKKSIERCFFYACNFLYLQ